MRLVIVTGMSGAGKTTALKTLEDMGFYCADNLPVLLIEKFAELVMNGQSEKQDIALGVDVRSGEELPYLEIIIRKWRENKYPFSILFLDSSDSVLVNRFQETRRKHPLSEAMQGSLEQAVRLEREMLRPVKEVSDYVIDTSNIPAAGLKARISDLFLQNDNDAITVHCISFGFKYGLPLESDLVFDVRCLPNPFYVEELREHTGLEAPVRDYVMNCKETEGFKTRFTDMIDYMLPLYIQEGKSQLVIAVGCTGGHHRSVALAQYMHDHLVANGVHATVSHRDITKQ